MTESIIDFIKMVGCQLGPGSMSALDTEPFLFLIKDTTKRLEIIPDNPMISIKAGLFNVISNKKSVWCHSILVSFDDIDGNDWEIAYDALYNYNNPSSWKIFSRLYKENFITFLFIDENNNLLENNIKVEIGDKLHWDISQYIEQCELENYKDWEDTEFNEAGSIIYKTFPNTKSMFEAILSGGNHVVINLDDPKINTITKRIIYKR